MFQGSSVNQTHYSWAGFTGMGLNKYLTVLVPKVLFQEIRVKNLLMVTSEDGNQRRLGSYRSKRAV